MQPKLSQSLQVSDFKKKEKKKKKMVNPFIPPSVGLMRFHYRKRMSKQWVINWKWSCERFLLTQQRERKQFRAILFYNERESDYKFI